MREYFRVGVSGLAKVGKGKNCEELARLLSLKFASAGGCFRAVARQRGFGDDYMKLEELAITDPSVDREVDAFVVKFARENPRCLIEGRRVVHVMRQAFYLDASILMTCRLPVRTARAANVEGTSRAEASRRIKKREAAANERYKILYGVSLWSMMEPTNFDFKINTSNQTPEQSLVKMLEFLRPRS
ncbi:TPA: hypothetical protein DCQ44_03445 [Candidatus Taylorbacteria bacterium]|nr:hypothetical protein [Candidatus Taylorbacteria bacterium]